MGGGRPPVHASLPKLKVQPGKIIQLLRHAASWEYASAHIITDLKSLWRVYG